MPTISEAVRMLEGRADLTDAQREWLRVLKEGDAEAGERIARNLLDEHKLTVRQAMELAGRILR